MAHGSIPVAFRTSSIPEVLGDAGIVLEKNEFMKLIFIIKDLINRSDYRAKLKSQSRKRAKKFSIENNIKKTIEVYNTVLSIKI
jgi:glycosyltransferase involved in cell wall biosynthesis